MRIVDSTGNSIQMDSAWLSRGAESLKLATYEYLFSDDTDVTWLGRGPVQLSLRYVCSTDELEEAALFLMRDEEFAIWFPSATGSADDRYYQRVVPTSGPRVQSRTASLHEAEFSLLALDPHVYDSDGQAVT